MRGLTLVEALIGVAILGLVAGGVYGVLAAGVDTYGTGMTATDLQSRATDVLDRIVEEFSTSGKDVIHPDAEPPYPTPTLTFQRNAGFASGAVVWDPATQVEFTLTDTEQGDGKDNDGNGLVDEGLVVLTRRVGEPDQERVVMTRWVRSYLEGEEPNGKDDNGNGLIDERGLSFSRTGDVWTIRLTLERRNPKGNLITRTVETSIKVRN